MIRGSIEYKWCMDNLPHIYEHLFDIENTNFFIINKNYYGNMAHIELKRVTIYNFAANHKFSKFMFYDALHLYLEYVLEVNHDTFLNNIKRNKILSSYYDNHVVDNAVRMELRGNNLFLIKI